MNLYPVLTMLWAVVIVVAACTADAHAFLYEQVIQFSFETAPNYGDLLIVSDIHLTKEFYLIQKVGHMFTFGVMYFLHLLWMRNAGTALVLTGLFAGFSEVLQLYFNRNGRLFDIGVDMVGICAAYFICTIVFNRISNYGETLSK